MPNSLKSHIETLREMFAVAANERRMKEADALASAIEALSRAPIAEGGESGHVHPMTLREIMDAEDGGTPNSYVIHTEVGDLECSLAVCCEWDKLIEYIAEQDAKIESLSRQGGESRCPHCDDTGDVHAPDGEWHGVCSCPAGDKIGKDAPETTRASEAGDWVLVPRYPTPKMIDATWNDAIETSGHVESHNTRNDRIYRAMIAAAPAPGGDA